MCIISIIERVRYLLTDAIYKSWLNLQLLNIILQPVRNPAFCSNFYVGSSVCPLHRILLEYKCKYYGYFRFPIFYHRSLMIGDLP